MIVQSCIFVNIMLNNIKMSNLSQVNLSLSLEKSSFETTDPTNNSFVKVIYDDQIEEVCNEHSSSVDPTKCNVDSSVDPCVTSPLKQDTNAELLDTSKLTSAKIFCDKSNIKKQAYKINVRLPRLEANFCNSDAIAFSNPYHKIQAEKSNFTFTKAAKSAEKIQLNDVFEVKKSSSSLSLKKSTLFKKVSRIYQTIKSKISLFEPSSCELRFHKQYLENVKDWTKNKQKDFSDNQKSTPLYCVRNEILTQNRDFNKEKLEVPVDLIKRSLSKCSTITCISSVFSEASSKCSFESYEKSKTFIKSFVQNKIEICKNQEPCIALDLSVRSNKLQVSTQVENDNRNTTCDTYKEKYESQSLSSEHCGEGVLFVVKQLSEQDLSQQITCNDHQSFEYPDKPLDLSVKKIDAQQLTSAKLCDKSLINNNLNVDSLMLKMNKHQLAVHKSFTDVKALEEFPLDLSFNSSHSQKSQENSLSTKVTSQSFASTKDESQLRNSLTKIENHISCLDLSYNSNKDNIKSSKNVEQNFHMEKSINQNFATKTIPRNFYSILNESELRNVNCFTNSDKNLFENQISSSSLLNARNRNKVDSPKIEDNYFSTYCFNEFTPPLCNNLKNKSQATIVTDLFNNCYSKFVADKFANRNDNYIDCKITDKNKTLIQPAAAIVSENSEQENPNSNDNNLNTTSKKLKKLTKSRQSVINISSADNSKSATNSQKTEVLDDQKTSLKLKKVKMCNKIRSNFNILTPHKNLNASISSISSSEGEQTISNISFKTIFTSPRIAASTVSSDSFKSFTDIELADKKKTKTVKKGNYDDDLSSLGASTLACLNQHFFNNTID